jgi:hypothetical protein
MALIIAAILMAAVLFNTKGSGMPILLFIFLLAIAIPFYYLVFKLAAFVNSIF